MVSYLEWLRMPEVQDATEEVVNGEVRIMPPAEWKHSEIVASVGYELRRQLERDGVWVVEVLAPEDTLRDKENLADYAEMQVPEVWVVSPEGRTIEVLLLENDYLRRSRLLMDGILQPKLFPHVRIDIAQIWPD